MRQTLAFKPTNRLAFFEFRFSLTNFPSVRRVLGYGELAARLAVSNLHKETSDVFSEVMEAEYRFVQSRIGPLFRSSPPTNLFGAQIPLFGLVGPAVPLRLSLLLSLR